MAESCCDVRLNVCTRRHLYSMPGPGREIDRTIDGAGPSSRSLLRYLFGCEPASRSAKPINSGLRIRRFAALPHLLMRAVIVHVIEREARKAGLPLAGQLKDRVRAELTTANGPEEPSLGTDADVRVGDELLWPTDVRV